MFSFVDNKKNIGVLLIIDVFSTPKFSLLVTQNNIYHVITTGKTVQLIKALFSLPLERIIITFSVHERKVFSVRTMNLIKHIGSNWLSYNVIQPALQIVQLIA